MKSQIRKFFSYFHSALLITLLAGLLVACSGQASTNSSTTTQSQGLPTSIPVTGATPVSTPSASSTSNIQNEASPAAPTQSQVSSELSAPQCNSPTTLTPSLTEGPYFKAGSPERTSLVDTGMTGTRLVLSGFVLTPDCQPVSHALLDFWQADAQGNYDNQGYTLRGHLFTDTNGYFQVETIVPGLYPGRTEHIHVKVQAPNGPILTTQLFFPGVQQNQSDGIYNQALLLQNVQQTSSGLQATYTFIVNPS